MHNLLFCAHTLCMNYVTNTFLLVSSSVRSKQLLCFVHGQGQKREQKPTTKKFVRFHNHSPLLTMLWFCITSTNDWFKVLALFFQPLRSETKTNRGSRVHVFPRFASATCNYFELSLVYWIISVLFDWPK